jgi:hypothetical protein
MHVLLDIKDEKSEHLLNVLRDLKYVKVKIITKGKSRLYKEISESVDELIEVLAGRKEARDVRELLNEIENKEH